MLVTSSTKVTSDKELYCCWLMVLVVLARGRGEVLLGQHAIRSGASSGVMIAKFDDHPSCQASRSYPECSLFDA
jgi:hypothetical protein